MAKQKELTKLEQAEKLMQEANAEMLKEARDEFNALIKIWLAKYPKATLDISVGLRP